MKRSKKGLKCPECGSRDVLLHESYDDGYDLYVCADCQQDFEIDSLASRKRRPVDYSDRDFDLDAAEHGWEN